MAERLRPRSILRRCRLILRERILKKSPRQAPCGDGTGSRQGWETLLDRFGTRGFDALFADAIRYAEDGFAVHQRFAWDWPRFVQDLAQNEGGARHCLVDGRAPREGERFRFPALAATLRTIASGGAKAFFRARTAR